MELLITYLTPIAITLNVPVATLQVVMLLLLGLAGHFFMRWAIRRLTALSDLSLTKWDDVVVYALSPPAEWVMWIVLVYLSLGAFDLFDALRTHILTVAGTGLMLLAGWFCHRLLGGIEVELLATHRGARDSDQRATISASTRLARIVVWVIVALTIMQSYGVSISGLLAFGGIGGIAVGFAAKDLLANFLGGLSIFLDRPFAVGDWIRSPDREIEGTVENIGWRMTLIRTFDQRPLYVPNAVFANVSVENPSRMRNRRIYETLGVRYADAHKMGVIVADVKAMLQNHADIDLERTLIVNFVSCGASSLDFFIYTFTKTTNWVEYHEIKQDVLLKILDIIERQDAEVAFPTRTLHLDPMADLPEPAGLGAQT